MATPMTKSFKFVSEHKLYYTAYEMMKDLAAQNAKGVNWGEAQKVFAGIHPSVFIHDKELDSFANKRGPMDYAVAMRMFFIGRYDIASRNLDGLEPSHPMYVERSYLKGLISLIKGEQTQAGKYFSSCIRGYKHAENLKVKPEGYNRMFRNRCIQQFARLLYAQGRHKDSLKILSAVPKTDFIWPNTLLERAWSNYYLGHEPISLGILTSFKAPILQRYMNPEAHYLKALIYFEMCYFDRAKAASNEFKNITWANRHFTEKPDANKLLKLSITRKEPSQPKDKFLYFYLKSFKKDIRHAYFLRAIKQIRAETKALAIIKQMPKKQFLKYKIQKQRSNIISDHKEFLVNLVADYNRQIQRTNQHFVKLNLMMSLKEREHIRKGIKAPQSKDIIDLDLADIGDLDNKYIFNFIGGFWADELGDYAVALEDKCKKRQ